MKYILIALISIPVLVNAQNIDVFVQGTTIEFSGSTYDLTVTNGGATLDVIIENNTGAMQNWDLERVSPSSNNWSESTLTWQSGENEFVVAGYQNSQLISPVFSTNYTMIISDGNYAYVELNWDNEQEGCDLYRYYVLDNNVRVDSFSVNLCKVLDLDEFEKDGIVVYPNPANSAINMTFHNQLPDDVKVHDILGDEIAVYKAKKTLIMSIEEFANGTYFLSGEIEGVRFRKKFQVHH